MQSLQKTVNILLLLFLIIAALILAKPFLVPVAFGGLFAMLFLPMSRRLERAGLPRGAAIAICILTLILVIALLITLITWQVNNLTSDLGNIEDMVKQVMDDIKQFFTRALGISAEEQQSMIKKQSDTASGFIANLGISIFDFLVGFILTIVYIFLFMYYRSHIKKFLHKIIPSRADEKADDALSNIEKVTQQYLTGMGIMIVCLWGMYSIAFTIVGLKNAFFFAILCGLFEIVPFVGNFTGNLLASLMAITQGGGFPMVLGVMISYAIVQFLQTYLLEPLVVGTEVNINPLFTIMGLVLGELIWGIPGMVLAIPLLGIAKIICDHVKVLKPYGFLIGRTRSGTPTLMERIQKVFRKK